MKPLEFPLLADECVSPEVVDRLRRQGREVQTVLEEDLAGASDRDILDHAHRNGQVVLTHDSDFGTLAIRQGQRYIGIVYLRPGHISTGYVIEMLREIDRKETEISPPFIIVAERRGESVRLRVRREPD